MVELHGTARRVVCIGAAPRHGRPAGCGFEADTTWAFEAVDAGEEDPACPRCGGLVKSATISFGQAMDDDAMVAAHELIRAADVVLVVGSSLQVYPAAAVPELALQNGQPLAIVNAEPTPLDAAADVVVHGRAGEVLAPAVAAVLEG
ncbi:NAD-dependent deacetylase [Euzebya sp.]|uniref:SIR2 family NAD-dependent protein deacylase n=1 Tax=Euzebya sp. TaxID=1971409 RepID=UPI003510FD53